MSQPRRNIRYKPDRLEHAQIMFDGQKVGWHPDTIALIIDLSALTGAQLVMLFNDRISSGQHVKVKLGQLDPLLAEVVWRKEVASDLIRVGIKLLE